MPALASLIILWAAPLVMVTTVIACAVFLQAFRRAHGAMRSTLGPTILIAAAVLTLHAGYLLGPLWLALGRPGIGLAAMLPAAALFALLAAVALKSGIIANLLRSDQTAARRLRAIFLLLIVVYAAPVVVMAINLAT